MMSQKLLEKPTVEKRSTHGGARDGAGRPGFEATDADRRQVEMLSGIGLPQDQIAALISGGIHVDTLRKHFADELTIGKAKANSQVAKTLFQKATSGDTTAAIWWTKTQMKWAETQRHQIGGDGENPLEVDVHVNVFGELLRNLKLQRQSE
jgi:hypothetical protein